MEEIMHSGQKWSMLRVPALEFCQIHKELGTQGNLYLLFDKNHSIAFVTQSVPLISKAVFLKTKTILYNSSIYRMIRKLAKKQTMKNMWKALKFKREELDEFNLLLKKFNLIFFITKDPDLYCFIAPEPDEHQNSERTCPEDHEPSD
jgi:hypothetical protein